MSHFDAHARTWDNNQINIDRSIAIAAKLEKLIPADRSLTALEYGAGTGILSFLLKDRFSEIVLMDNSIEMIKICEEKREHFRTAHVKPLFFDLEQNEFEGKFDVIYSQMVFHHVTNTDSILQKFVKLLNPGGLLFIADLYLEDGSFHGPDVIVHHGFDPLLLSQKLGQKGFIDCGHSTCFTITRPNGIDYPVFLLKAKKPDA